MAKLLPMLVIADTPSKDSDQILTLDAKQLAAHVDDALPGKKGNTISRFIRAIDVSGWQFSEISETDVQRMSEDDPFITDALLAMQGKAPRDRKIALVKLYPHLDGHVRRASSLQALRAQQETARFHMPLPAGFSLEPPVDPIDASHNTTLPSPPPSEPTTEMALPQDDTPPSPPSLPSPLSTPVIEHPPTSTASSSDSFVTAYSRINVEGEDLNDESSPAKFHRDDEEYDSDSGDEQSLQGSPDALLTPLILVPNLNSDLEPAQIASPSTTRGEKVGGLLDESLGIHPDGARLSQAVVITEKAPGLHLDVTFPTAPSFAEELSTASPHFATIPLTRVEDPITVALSPRHSRVSLSPGEHLSPPRTLFPAAELGYGRPRRMSNGIPWKAPTAGPQHASSVGRQSPETAKRSFSATEPFWGFGHFFK